MAREADGRFGELGRVVVSNSYVFQQLQVFSLAFFFLKCIWCLRFWHLLEGPGMNVLILSTWLFLA